MIQRLIQQYKEVGIVSGDPFKDVKDLLDLFYSNENINNFTTMVFGSDLCEMLGLFHDLAEAIGEINAKKVAELEKYKIAYNNRIRRDNRKKQEVVEEEKRHNEADDEKFVALRQHNTSLLMENSRL